MIDHRRLYIAELKAHCRKRSLDPHRPREALKDSLMKCDNESPITKVSTLGRITMNVADGTDYNDHLCHELEDECYARRISIGHEEYKENLVHKLLRYDEDLLYNKSRAPLCQVTKMVLGDERWMRSSLHFPFSRMKRRSELGWRTTNLTYVPKVIEIEQGFSKKVPK